MKENKTNSFTINSNWTVQINYEDEIYHQYQRQRLYHAAYRVGRRRAGLLLVGRSVEGHHRGSRQQVNPTSVGWKHID